ncbi:MAG: helix-turn-helix domain-containing protein [Clostridia bacterium]|nr:dNA-binding helix-turn-helix protein [Clostridium sp. CAG:389]
MKKTSLIKIGKNIQKIRKSNGYTQEKLAEEIEVSVRYISDIEQDKSKPSYEVLIKICNVFQISLDQVFSEYLNIKENKSMEYSLAGFDKLSKKDKETIENLIMYFNKI